MDENKGTKHLMKMIDELVQTMDNDPELKDAMKDLDEKARKKGITLYDMVFEVLLKHDADERASEWLRKKND